MTFQGILVVGTDTSVGKTTVGQGLLRLARRCGLQITPAKPAETGVPPGEEPPDAAALRTAARRSDLSLAQICPFRSALPVAPAAVPGLHLRPAGILAALEELAALGAPLHVESAGGLLSPYAPGFSAADLATSTGLPVLLVAKNGLGTINHTALALSEIKRRNIPLAGLVLVHTEPTSTPDHHENPALIHAQTGVRPLFILPYVPSPSPDPLADAVAKFLTPEELRRLYNAPLNKAPPGF